MSLMNAREKNAEKTGFDAIVVGAGPSGSSATLFLSRRGMRVLLVDKAVFPRDKACGDGISGKSIKVLDELGLLPDIEKAEHLKIYGVRFSSPKGEVLDIPIPDDQEVMKYGYDCRREVFDNVLFQNAKKAATQCIEGFTVTDILKDGETIVGVKGTNAQGKEQSFAAPVVVGADSANSVIARKAGLWKINQKHHFVGLRAYYTNVGGMKDYIELHFLNSVLPGYFWIFPFKDGKANVGIGMVLEKMNEKKVTLQDVMFSALEKDPLFRERFAKAERISPVKAWNLPLASAYKPIVGQGLVLVGDAASLIDPFTGEGIGNALISGKFAAQAIVKAHAQKDFSKTFFAREYEQALWAEIGREVKNSLHLQKLTNHPWLFNLIVSKANRNPAIAKKIGDSLVQQESRKSMESPLFYLKALFA